MMNDMDFFWNTVEENNKCVIENVDSYRLETILFEKDIGLRLAMLKIYKEALKNIPRNPVTTKIMKELEGESIQEILYAVESHKNDRNEYVAFYLGLDEYTAKNDLLCDIEGVPIHAGERYCAYRPFFVNVETNERFILKRTIKACYYYYDWFPTTIAAFEELDAKLASPFSSRAMHAEDAVDYYAMSQRVGEGLYVKKVVPNLERQKVRRKLRKLKQQNKKG